MAVGHTPVMVKEVLELLQPKPEGIYLDATLGAGGHAGALLEKTEGKIQLIGIDQDPQALQLAKTTLQNFGERIVGVENNFGNIRNVLADLHIERLDGIVADLGLSSMQLSEPARGFSFQSEGPLDMRMGPGISQTAKDLLENLDEEALANLLYQYGEERLSRKIARRIREALQEGSLETTRDLADLVWHCYPPKARHGRIHPATRVFQALRIAVNGELDQLKKFLEEAPDCLNTEGVLAVISYHSLEDRLVKHRFKDLAQEEFEVLTKKPLTASDEEREQNPRSRSAKLRGLRRKEF